ncbi:MAG: DNA polymerase IV [Bacilli bacterium]|nr:DNA polymerase IV [Bacilli bacterium]
MRERVIFHIDVNNAFLSWTAVKMLKEGYKTDIRTIPSVIGGDESKRHGIVLAKSPVAKKYGIKTAETIYSARKKCHSLKIYPADHNYYNKISKELFNHLLKYSPDMEQISVDECFLDMSQTSYLYDNLVDLAYSIKDEIQNKFGFTVNIGIGNNKLCAKMASDFEKPNKVHTLFEDEIEEKMWPLSVNDLFMVGRKSAEKLELLGIKTIGDLANTNINFLKKHFKSMGIKMWEYANGIDDSKVVNEYDVNKCISVSETFEVDVDNTSRLKRTLLKQTEKVAHQLRKQNCYTRTVAITIRTYDFKNFSKQLKLHNPTNITNEIYEKVLYLFETFWDGTKIRNIGVRVSDFTNHCDRQLSLFEKYNEKDQKIQNTLDNINDKFGYNVVTKASLIDKENN